MEEYQSAGRSLMLVQDWEFVACVVKQMCGMGPLEEPMVKPSPLR